MGYYRLSLRNIIKVSLIGSIGILFILYILYQSRVLLRGPIVHLDYEPDIRQESRSLYLEGNAQNISEISLNGRTIVTTETGDFKEQVILENGYTIVSIDAEDRYGRSTRLERTFVYSPQSQFIQ